MMFMPTSLPDPAGSVTGLPGNHVIKRLKKSAFIATAPLPKNVELYVHV